MEKERLQKILSRCGYGSRRACDKLIADNRVTLNGKPAQLGEKADFLRDSIKVDGAYITKIKNERKYIALYKPQKVLSAIKKQDDRTTVIDLVNIDEYVFIVGRLDFMSEGLILLTNDGEIANKLTHPRYEHEKEYQVLVKKQPDREQINTWQSGVVLPNGYRTLPAQVTKIETGNYGTWLKVIMREGKNRQIREIGKLIGLPVKRIIRTRIATIGLENLKPGEWRFISEQEIQSAISNTNCS